MRNINLRYCEETYDEQGVLTDFKVKCPDTFNFGYDVVDDIAENDPDRRAMMWCNPEGEEHLFTFADMKSWSDKTANYLAAHGLGKGDMVMVILRRHYQFWFVATALAKLGAVMVPATFMLKEHDLEYRLNGASIKAVICTSIGTIAQVVDNVVDRCPSVEHLFLVNGAGGGLTEKDADGNWLAVDGPVGAVLSGPEGVCAVPAKREGWHDFNTGVRSADEGFSRVETHVGDPMLMYFSSGTSGNPKMVLHDSYYALAHLVTAKHWHNVKPDGLHLTIADTGWGKAVWGKLYGQWIAGANVFVYDFEKFKPVDVLQMIHDHHITSFCAPPTVFRFLIREDLSKFDISSLKYCTIAGEALNPSVYNEWLRLTGIKLMEGFGQTETTLTIATFPWMEPKPGSMGVPNPEYVVDLLKTDGTSAAPGEQGQIVIRTSQGKSLGLFKEYYRNPDLTREVWHDGIYYTGDVAWKDEDGYFWFVGRVDDVIKSSGYRIGPFEVESALMTHPAVVECAITGVPDEIRGQIVKATIVLAKDYKDVDKEHLVKTLQNHVKQVTAPYKYPRVIEFVDELPKTISGKIRRVEIRNKDNQKS